MEILIGDFVRRVAREPHGGMNQGDTGRVIDYAAFDHVRVEGYNKPQAKKSLEVINCFQQHKNKLNI